MAGYKNTSITFSIVTVILLVSSSLLRVRATADHDDSKNDGSSGSDGSGQHTVITKKYRFVWTKSALPTPRYDFSDFNDDIESVKCTSDINCTAALPGVEAALLFDSDIPSAPYCNMVSPNSTASSYCTCGERRCVSYSREFETGDPFYYCGPCGYVGSQCTRSCSHKLAECRNGYCECIEDGTFYNMSYCYIPLYGQETMVNILIGTTVVLLCCVTLAYGYHRLSNRRHRRRGSIYSERGNGTARRESPADDTPPTYDDVVEKLPSYQDALQMSTTGDDGVTNPAFEEDDAAPPQYKTRRDSISSSATAVSQTKATSPSKVLNPTESQTTRGDAEDNSKIAALSEIEKCSNCKPPVTEEQQGLGTQPIELLLHNTLQTQHTTTTL